jgi:hypothetical protein
LRPTQANRAHLQNNQSKWTGGVAQAVEYLLSKHETLSSEPESPPQKKKKKKKIESIEVEHFQI